MQKCPSCGAENPIGSANCAACGAALHDTENLLAGIVCSHCDTFNPPDSAKCSRCGKPLESAADDLVPEAASADAPPETTQVEPRPPLPAGEAKLPSRRPTDSMPAAVAFHKPASRCPYCKSLLPAGALACPVCTRPVASAPAEPPSQAPAELSIRLRLCRGFGREDATYPVGPAGVTIGRGPATIEIAEDPFLSPVHAAVLVREGKLWLEDRSDKNGTFLRVRGKTSLQQGSEIIVGHQRIGILGFGGPTTDPRVTARTETRVLGGPPSRHLFLALRCFHATATGAAVAGPVMLRSGPVVTLGSEGCHINFPGDSRLASHHAELHLRPSGIELVATGPTGAFVRVRATSLLQNGDEIMLGEEILRLEMN